MGCCGKILVEPTEQGVAAPTPTSSLVPFDAVARFDEHNLAVGKRGRRFNPSLIAFEGGYLFAYRDWWSGSRIHVVRLDTECRPIGEPRPLRLLHRRANVGCEDPRLFWHGGKVHVSFIGVEGGPRTKGVVTNQLFARLSHDLDVEDVFYPVIPGRREWEKNHSYFEHDGQLHAVYTVDPYHEVLRINSNAATFAYRTITPHPWNGGEQRGGAAPVRVGDEYWHFTHARRRRADTGRQDYEVGLYTFDAAPPFRPRRVIPSPLMLGTQSPQLAPPNYADVAFPCGAVRDVLGLGFWMISLGVHDRWSEIRAVRHDELESRLVPVVERDERSRFRRATKTPTTATTPRRYPPALRPSSQI